jgi:hypothetical protein
VLDGGGTLSTTGVAAIDIDGAPLEIDLTFESVSVSGAANGLLLRDTTGSFSVTGSGTADGSGGSVSGIDERGVSVIAGENVALANMTFSGTPTGDGSGCDAAGNAGCHAAIHLEQSSGIALDNVDIAGGTQQGVNGLDIRDLTLSNSTVTGCGDGVDEGCLRLVDLAGSSAIIDSDLSFPADRVARIVNTDTDLTLTVSGSSFRDSQSSGVGADGLEIASSGGSTSVDIEDSTFVRNATNGLQLLNEGSADVRVDVTGSTFDPQAGPGIGIDLATADTASLTFNVIGNPRIGGNGGSAVNIFADGDATVRGRIDDNPDIRTGGAGTSGFGIRVAANGDADVVAQIEGNTISEIGFDAGIQVLSRLGSTGRADAVVRDNSVDVDAGALYDIWIQAQDGNTVCAHLSDNSASGSGVSALRARTSTAGAEVILQGSGASAAAVWNGGNNTPVDAVSSSHVGTLTLGGTCAVVAHPLP